ncbi:MAG TPA: MopE-related protein [Polyangiales bacterium]|nr:MopE-related protein [Polyangiales bacterium]
MLRWWLVLGVVLSGCGGRTRGRDPGPFGAAGTAVGQMPGRDAGPEPCARCDDGVFCNGAERCALDGKGCLPAETSACDDRDECTRDRCDERARSCEHAAQPRDQDADGVDACDGDCDDRDPAVHPGAAELCDQRDQDCDRSADEGTRSACGDCRPGCRLLFLPPRGELWDPRADNSEAVALDPGGERLMLTADARQRFDAWIANFADGKVTKLDTRTGVQLARYDSVLLDGANGAAPPDERCERNTLGDEPGGNCPSRTAVDHEGAVFVANRAFGRQGTVTKIAGFEDDCVDRDGDGELQTSRDRNDNGQIDAHVEGEFYGQDDECLLWTVDTGSPGAVPRALAVAGDGSVWLGLHGESRVLQLDPSDGHVLRSIPVPGFKPYGAALDPHGRVWLTEAGSGSILAIDTASGTAGKALTAPEVEAGCPSSYGIAVDPEGRVWIAGFTCPFAFGYDPDAERWRKVALPESGVTRGIAADDRGNVLIASSHAWIKLDPRSAFGFFETSDPIARLTAFRAADGGDVRIWGTAADPLPGRGAIGLGLDSERRAWLINQDSGSATRVDLETSEVKHFGVGDMPYTYSDFTGFALRRISAPSGFYRGVLRGCERGASSWEELRVDAQLNGGRIEVRARSADDERALAGADWIGSFGGARADLRMSPGPLPGGRLLELEARLFSGDGRSSPALREISVQLLCSQ